MISVYIVLVAALASTCAVEVTTSLGAVRGVILKSRLGQDFYAFRGIRYAKPPVGELRFKSPQPVDPWKPKVFDATDDGPICPQTNFNSSDYSEDCLCINVYSKNLDTKALKPVVIYIHPGAWYVASGHSRFFSGPHMLMDRDIVLVTINYRLSTLGFLATGTADAPGNAGLKDQVLAFKWVRDHIRNFGGNPSSVTLLGYSAGSVSIGLHMASPMSQGLFHRGIAMSASPISQVIYPTEQLELAKRQADLLNCPKNNVDAMVKCIREAPVDEIVRTIPGMFEFGSNRVLNWMPVIENDVGQERFIVEDPTKSYQAGRIQRVPLIIGMNEYEFVKNAYDLLQNETQTQQLNENWDTLAPGYFQYNQYPSRSKEISGILRKEYLDNKPLQKGGEFDSLGKLYCDAVIGFGVHRFAHLAARYVPVHYYRFSYTGRYSFFTLPGNKPYGAVHHDELLYLLYIPVLTPLFSKSDPEDRNIEQLTRMWTQFAKTGDPNNSTDDYLKNLRWNPLDLKKENYLDIGNDLVNREGLYLERFALWNKLFPLNWTGIPCKHHSDSLDYPEPDESTKH